MTALDFINGLNDNFSKTKDGVWITDIKNEKGEIIKPAHFTKVKSFSLTNKQGCFLMSLLTKDKNKPKGDGEFTLNGIIYKLIQPPSFIKTNGFYALETTINF